MMYRLFLPLTLAACSADLSQGPTVWSDDDSGLASLSFRSPSDCEWFCGDSTVLVLDGRRIHTERSPDRAGEHYWMRRSGYAMFESSVEGTVVVDDRNGRTLWTSPLQGIPSPDGSVVAFSDITVPEDGPIGDTGVVSFIRRFEVELRNGLTGELVSSVSIDRSCALGSLVGWEPTGELVVNFPNSNCPSEAGADEVPGRFILDVESGALTPTEAPCAEQFRTSSSAYTAGGERVPLPDNFLPSESTMELARACGY